MSRFEEFGIKTDERISFKGKKIRQYSVWNGIIQRCYNDNCEPYKYYGEKGVTICEEWKLFSNFKKWYDENYPNNGSVYYLDKDILCEKLGIHPKIYSPETCIFVTKEENSKEMASRNKKGEESVHSHPKSFYETNPIKKSHFQRACKLMGWDYLNFHEIWNGDWYTKPSGQRCRIYLYKEMKDGEERRFDSDLKNSIELIISKYETKSVTKGHFKKVCKNNDLAFEDFECVFSEKMSGEAKKFYFFHKNKEVGQCL